MCDAEKIKGLDEIEPLSIFGFDGRSYLSFRVHPDNKHILFPLGNRICIMEIKSTKQQFLCGHTNTISNCTISKSGTLAASGQTNHMGFRALTIIWDWETRSEKVRHELHKVHVQAICFTSTEKYLVSLGGRDDGMIIVWDIENNSPLCSAAATREVTGDANRIRSLNRRGSVFVSGGETNLRIWCIDHANSQMHVQDVTVGKLRREYTGMRVNSRDDILYAGTMTGDVVKVRLNCHADPDVIFRDKPPVMLCCMGIHNPKKPYGKDCELYSSGVRELFILPSNNLIIGSGDGVVDLVEERPIKYKDYPSPTWPLLKSLKRKKLHGAITSIQLLNNDTIMIGTALCEIYSIVLATFVLKLLITCNSSTIYDIAFPHNFSLVFATASFESVRVWSTTKFQELLRIMVPNFSAAAVVFSYDGKSIITAWNDGVIRAFTPLTGKLIYAIPNAHNKGCSALTISRSGQLLVSGGCEGQVRIWKIEPIRQSLLAILKDHIAPISTVDLNVFDTEVVSASSDGTCIIWDIIRLQRKHVLYANTQFTSARYYPNGVQILTSGSDRRISYWEVYDASLIRDVEGSVKGPLNCISLNPTGDTFVSVGNDQIVKLWDYAKAIPLAAGYGHASIIVTCQFSPCGKFFVTGSADGAVFIWPVPEKYREKSNGLKDEKSNEDKPKSKPNSVASSKKSRSSIASSEHIKELESSRTNKDVCICECPPVNSKSKPNINEKCIRNEKGGPEL